MGSLHAWQRATHPPAAGLTCACAGTCTLPCAVRELAPPGDLNSTKLFPFEFKNVELQYDSYRGQQARPPHHARIPSSCPPGALPSCGAGCQPRWPSSNGGGGGAHACNVAVQVRCRYLLRVTVTGKGMTPDSKREFNIWVINYEPVNEAGPPIKAWGGGRMFSCSAAQGSVRSQETALRTSVRDGSRVQGWVVVAAAPAQMEVGIEDCLHIEFEYDRARYHLRDVVVGRIYFLLVSTPVLLGTLWFVAEGAPVAMPERMRGRAAGVNRGWQLGPRRACHGQWQRPTSAWR